jgi:uncharacterized membrane protein (Fun14 family)
MRTFVHPRNSVVSHPNRCKADASEQQIATSILYEDARNFSFWKEKQNYVRTMSIPPEIAWIVPVVLPFIIGLLVGVIVKKGLKLLIAVAALIVVLIATGILGLTFSDVFDQAMQFLPKLYDVGRGWLEVLPYTSIAFVIGAVLGFLFS